MDFRLLVSDEARQSLDDLKKSNLTAFKAVRKSIGLMQTNLRHPSLQTHQYDNLLGPNGEKIFESYAQNKTPGAYRIFWYYGPEKGFITIADILCHP